MCIKKYFRCFIPICLFSCILLLFNLEAGAQNNIIFCGRILNNETNKPLPFVTIEIRKSGTGVITNEFGELKYHIPQSFENDRVQIFSIYRL